MSANDDKEKRFTAVYKAEADTIFRFCYFRTSDRNEALDITQETFMRLWDAFASGQPITNERAFMFTVARHLIIDHYRKKKTLSLEQLTEGDDSESRLPKDRSETVNAEARYLISKIEELGEPYRQAVYLRLVEELSPAEIAAQTGEAANTISVRINRGLKKFRKLIGGK